MSMREHSSALFKRPFAMIILSLSMVLMLAGAASPFTSEEANSLFAEVLENLEKYYVDKIYTDVTIGNSSTSTTAAVPS